MKTSELASRICGDLVRDVSEVDDRTFIVTNFHYPDGDFVSIYIDDMSVDIFDQGDSIGLSDRGVTLFKCRENGIDITPLRTRFIDQVCESYDVKHDRGVLRKVTSLEKAGIDAISFCEAITRISSLEYEKSQRYVSSTPERVARLLNRRVAITRAVEQHWSDSVQDPKGSHPVDFRVNGKGEPRNIFTVTSNDKCTTVAAITHFYQSRKIWVPTLSIIDPYAGIGEMFLDRLSAASTIKQDVTESDDSIVEFALSGLPAESQPIN